MFATSSVKSLKRVRIFTFLLSLLGIALSGYSIFVHYRKGTDKNYTAYCDINEEISCSKVFTSRWGKGFGFLSALLGEDSPLIVSNGVYGIIFYALVIVLGEFSSLIAVHIQRIVVVATNLLSIYLGYILLFVLKDKCVVCFSIYAINFLIAIACFVRVRTVTSLKNKKKGNTKSQGSQQNTQKKEGKKGNNQHSNKNANKNAQNSTKQQEQNSNKNTQVLNKSSQNENKKSNSKKNDVVNNKNEINSKKNSEQIKNVSNAKSQQNSNKKIPNGNKTSTNKNNANSNKHSKKKN